ncbi:HNH endonuclease [Bradyrhizobium sp. SEMIA]|uniref:HNH endonuclease n=1 Tax=Bradyrhizobium sp. SEMIA TaxID=2597515 RepID=UPI0018A345AA|nr:HNH endonuclease signature motif containing protein [Bradyrhizobium sp. SEMIA]QOG20443.1 HNH endonuclease [Bradyrhizobium sp. SEMIA]
MPVKPPTFRPQGQRSRRQANVEYDAKRGSARQRGYSPRWDKAAYVYKGLHPFCVGCKAVGRLVASEVVDHIIPHKGDQKLMWDEQNWQPACRFHHDVVKQKLEVMFAQGDVSAADLHLNSAIAVELTRDLVPELRHPPGVQNP